MCVQAGCCGAAGNAARHNGRRPRALRDRPVRRVSDDRYIYVAYTLPTRCLYFTFRYLPLLVRSAARVWLPTSLSKTLRGVHTPVTRREELLFVQGG